MLCFYLVPPSMKQSADVLGLHYHATCADRRTADASTIWTPVSNCSGTGFARCSGPPEYIQACRHFRCDACEDTKPKPQSTKVALPKDYVFGRNLGIDVLEVKDIADEPYLCLNILDFGTTFQQVVLLRQGHCGSAGWPQTLSCDRGVHNRCVFARALARGPDPPGRRGEPPANRTSRAPRRIVQGGAEADGRRSRCPGLRRHKSRDRRGREHQEQPQSQRRLLTLAMGIRDLATRPRDQFDEQEFTDLGPLQGQLEPGTAFARRAELRASARRAFTREDCGRRVARVVLREGAPLVGEYATGDIVCNRKDDQGWSPDCRLVGFDGNKTTWLICAGSPCAPLSTACGPRLQLKRSPCISHKT